MARGGNNTIPAWAKGPSPSNRWFYNGNPIPVELVNQYSSEEFLPDGIRLKPFRLRRHKGGLKGRRFEPSIPQETLETRQEERSREYESLIDDPKPDFFVWAFQREKRRLFDNLERVALNSALPRDAVNATRLMFEFGQEKPKTKVELEGAGAPQLADYDLLSLALQINGLDPNDVIPRLLPEMTTSVVETGNAT